MLKAKRLTAQQAAKLFEKFYEAHGPEVMARAYGWTAPDARSLRSGEKVWAFTGPAPTPDYPNMTATIGWGICMLSSTDPDDTEATLVLGVFPEFQRRGYRAQIFDWLSAWAKSKGADYARMIVFKDNEAHYERTIAETKKESPWTYAGDVWYPEPGYGIFVRDLDPEGEAGAPDALRPALKVAA